MTNLPTPAGVLSPDHSESFDYAEWLFQYLNLERSKFEAQHDATTGVILDTAALKPTLYNARGDLISASADNTPALVSIPNGFIPKRDNTQTNGWIGVDPATFGGGGGMTNPMTTAQDLIRGDTAGAPARIAVGANGQVLKVVSGAVAWANESAGGGTPSSTVVSETAFGAAAAAGIATAYSRGDHTHGSPTNPVTGHEAAGDPHTQYMLESLVDAKGDIITATANDTPARLPVGTNGQYLTAQSGQATGLQWATLPASISPTIVDAKGDIIAATAADVVARLPVGTNGQVLKANSGTATGLEWAAESGGGSTNMANTNAGNGSAAFANSAAANTVVNSDIALPGTLSPDSMYQVNIWNPSSQSAISLIFQTRENLGGADRWCEVARAGVPLNSAKSVLVQGWLLGSGNARIVFSNDTVLNSSGAFTASYIVRMVS